MEQNGLKSYFNYHNSSNLTLIKNCWQSVKHTLCKYPYLNDVIIEKLIYEKWNYATQQFINKNVVNMPEKLHAVKNGKEKITDY